MSKKTRELWRRRQRGPPSPHAPVPPPPDAGGVKDGGAAGARERRAGARRRPGGAGLAKWSVPDHAGLVDALRSIVNDPRRRPRERIRAAATLLQCERLELESLRTGLLLQENQQILTELEALKRKINPSEAAT